MDKAHQVAQLLVLCLVAGILGQILSALSRLPSIVFLLILGVALGPDGLGWARPASLGAGLEVIVRLGVAFILFEGAMSLQWSEIRKVQKSVRRLITVGVLLTFGAATAAAHGIAGLPISQAALFGALVTVTGPTVIRPLVQRVRVRPEIAAIMEGEGILADPIGAILAAVCLEYALSTDGSVIGQSREFGLRIATGVVLGLGCGAVAGFLVKIRRPALERIKPLIVLSCALGCYILAEIARPESGIMAVVAAGLAVQHGIARHDRDLREFKHLLTTLLLSVMFILLAANLRKEQMIQEGLPGLATVLVVMFLIRPANVFLSTLGGKPTLKEKIFLSWVAPRGIVAASVASLSALLLQDKGATGAHRVESLVFLTVFLTVGLQGATAHPLAWMLRILVREARAVIVVGADAISLAVAHVYAASGGARVTLIDRNPALIEAARKAGLQAILGDATDRQVLREAGLDEADVFIALTPSTTVNQTAAQVMLHERTPDQLWIALDSDDRAALDPVLANAGADVAFGRPIAMDVWHDRLSAGTARLIEVEVTDANAPKAAIGETRFLDRVVPVLHTRNGRTELVGSATRLRRGDHVTLLAQGGVDELIRDTLGIMPGP